MQPAVHNQEQNKAHARCTGPSAPFSLTGVLPVPVLFFDCLSSRLAPTWRWCWRLRQRRYGWGRDGRQDERGGACRQLATRDAAQWRLAAVAWTPFAPPAAVAPTIAGAAPAPAPVQSPALVASLQRGYGAAGLEVGVGAAVCRLRDGAGHRG
jgi:hypothetical protein